MGIVPTGDEQRNPNHDGLAADGSDCLRTGSHESLDEGAEGQLPHPLAEDTEAEALSNQTASDLGDLEDSDDADPLSDPDRCKEAWERFEAARESVDLTDVPYEDLIEFLPQHEVKEWEITAVGQRPQDYLGRDCLFGALFRDPRATWFHNYVRRPSGWMRELVRDFPTPAQRRQALCHVALHLLHRSHLARLIPLALAKANADEEEDQDYRTLLRLWRCPPYGVLLRRSTRYAHPLRVCGLAWLCPWCHARKVVALYERLRQGPLQDPKGKCLLYGKAAPFGEPQGGIAGEYDWEDAAAIRSSVPVRGHCGRYYGRDPERVAARRKQAVRFLLEQARPYITDGLWTHQLSSHQEESGRRTFRHDAAVFGLTGVKDLAELKRDAGTAWHRFREPDDRALRAVLAGASPAYLLQSFGSSGNSNPRDFPNGIEGAFAWQPTFLLDDRVWSPYVVATRNCRLYHAFGDWKQSLGNHARAKRESTPDRQFARAQAARHAQKKQQRGNRQRQRQVQERRQKLLEAARLLWEQVQAQPHHGRGRPPHRSRLEELLKRQGIRLDRRDRDWLMKELRRDR